MIRKPGDVCELFCYNEKKVEALKRSMPPQVELTNLTDIFKVLADRSRTRILLALSKGELCVCDVAHVLGLFARRANPFHAVNFKGKTRCCVFHTILLNHCL